MGGIFKAIGKVAKIAIPAAIAYYTGGLSTAAGTGIAGLSAAGTSAAASVASGIVSTALAPKAPKQSAVTGVTQSAVTSPATATAAPVDNTAEIARVEQQKRLALNAGADTSTTTPLGVTTKATVTKKKLLGA